MGSVKTIKMANATVGQSTIRQLSLVSIFGTDAAAFEDACKAVLTLNPMLGMDGAALYRAGLDGRNEPRDRRRANRAR